MPKHDKIIVSGTVILSRDKIKLLRQNCRMKYALLITRIEKAMDALGISERKLCMTAGVGEHAIRNIRKGHAPKPDNLHKIALVLGIPDAYLLEAAATPTPRNGAAAGIPSPHDAIAQVETVYVKGAVQAGLWQDALEWPAIDWKQVYIPTDLRYPNTPRFGLEVRGPSMNKIYPEGSIIIAVKLDDIGRQARSGERVVVLRRSNNSSEMEATVKKYEITPDEKHVLWPESTDPFFQSPIILNELAKEFSADSLDADHAACCDVEIYAVVVGSYRPE